MKNRTVEILAPAGSYESMVAAVNAGADAVYIGGSRFGARAYANNLDEETMVKAIDFMHLHGCRIYMTVNTLVKEKEMSDMYSYLKPYYEAGLDAVLVQDMGAFTYIRKHFPDLPVHISTQMTSRVLAANHSTPEMWFITLSNPAIPMFRGAQPPKKMVAASPEMTTRLRYSAR